MPDQPLLATHDEGVVTLQLNRPQALNALTKDSVRALHEQLSEAASSARAVVITGDQRAFCSGADLSGANNGNQGETMVELVNRVMQQLSDYQLPTIAAVSGPAAGVGCSLALACDIVIMSPSAYYMLAFTRIGLMPDGGASALVAASAGRHRALKMALTGEKVSAATAVEWGLATEAVDTESPLERAQEIARRFASGPTLSYGKTKHAINRATLPDLSDVLTTELIGQEFLRTTADFAEGVRAFREKRPADFSGK